VRTPEAGYMKYFATSVGCPGIRSILNIDKGHH
jgi:hypothetical protein